MRVDNPLSQAITANRGREGETQSPNGPTRPQGWEDRSGKRRTGAKK